MGKNELPIEEQSIRVLNLRGRISNTLERNGINTIGQLIIMTEELSNIPDLYEGYQTEIIMRLCENGLILRRDNIRQNYHDEVENFESSMQGNKQTIKGN